MHIVEHIEGDPNKFGLRKGSLPQGDQTTVLKAASEEHKKQWIKTLRELLLVVPGQRAATSTSFDTDSIGSASASASGTASHSEQRHSNASYDSVTTAAANQQGAGVSNNDVFKKPELRRRKNSSVVQPAASKPPPTVSAKGDGTPLDDENYLLPLDEGIYENIVSCAV